MSYSCKLEAITAAAGEAQLRLLYCALCPDTLASDWSQSPTIDWCLNLTCRSCKKSWSVCRLCSLAVTRFECREQIKRHNARYHRRSVVAVAVPAAARAIDTIIEDTNDQQGSSTMELHSPDAETIFQDTNDQQLLTTMDVHSPDAGGHDDYTVTTDDNWIASFDSPGPESNTEDRYIFPNESVCDDDNHAPPDFKCLGNDISASYFKNHHNGHGNSYLVAMSQYHRDNVTSFLEDADVELQMYISFLVDSLTKPQRHYFADVLARVVATCNSTTAQNDKTSPHKQAVTNESSVVSSGNPTFPSDMQYRCEIPRTYNHIRSWILDGKFSIFQNIPKPSVHLVGDHACVSIHDCLADLLGHGFPIDELDPKGSFTATVENSRIDRFSRAHTIMGNAQRLQGSSSADHAIVVCLTSWSDDFEPNYSIKGNRGSVWIKTITIALPAGCSQSVVYTYPVAIGPKGANHDDAEKYLLLSLKPFMTTPLPYLYSGIAKKMTPVYMESFASLQDQPERRDMLFLARGNATYHARWGYSMDCNKLKNVLLTCDTCLESLKKECRDPSTFLTAEWRTGSCDKCSCWAYKLPSKHLRFLPPKDYPVDKIADDGFVPALRLSFPLLRQVVEDAHEKVRNTSWKEKEAIAYLRAHCLSKKAIEAIVARATNCSLFEDIQSTRDITSDEYRALTEEKLNSPEQFERWPLPSLWDDSIPLERYGDVPMHLLFLGVGKTLVLDTQEWLKARNAHSRFVTYASRVLSSVEALQLDWCKVLPYSSGKFGGWVSENYLALVRIFKWIYAPIVQMELDAAPFVEPETPQQQWNKTINMKWLRLRGLDTSGNALEVRDRVAEYLKEPNGGPALMPSRGGTGTQLLCMLNRYSDLVCLLMDKHSDETHVRNVEVYVRLFLSEYKLFAEQLYGAVAENGTPAWIAKYNFMSLLNLSEQIKEVGPLRTLWEGGTRGEGYLRVVKPQIKTGLKTNWQSSLMQTLLRSKSMYTLTRAFTSIPISGNSQYRVYPSSASLEMMWGKRMPLSVVVKNNSEFMAAYQKTKEVCWMRFLRLAHVAEINEMSFFKISRDDVPQNFVVDDNAIGAMLLPRVSITGLPKVGDEAVYSCITSDWSILVHSSGLFSPLSRHSVK